MWHALDVTLCTRQIIPKWLPKRDCLIVFVFIGIVSFWSWFDFDLHWTLKVLSNANNGIYYTFVALDESTLSCNNLEVTYDVLDAAAGGVTFIEGAVDDGNGTCVGSLSVTARESFSDTFTTCSVTPSSVTGNVSWSNYMHFLALTSLAFIFETWI